MDEANRVLTEAAEKCADAVRRPYYETTPTSGRTTDDFSQVAPVETVSSSDGRGWRGVRVLRFRHTSGEVEVPPFT